MRRVFIKKIFESQLNPFQSVENTASQVLWESFDSATQIALSGVRKYFRLQTHGLHNLPRVGSAIIAPNHSGFSGFDALIMSHEIRRQTGRIPHVMTHRFWFSNPAFKTASEKAGLIEATTANGLASLEKNNLLVLFPEGENGNFKPTTSRYQLQEFKRGFVRMALEKQVPIIPTLVLGAEESSINLAKLQLGWLAKSAVLPLPLNLIPFPAKWSIHFLQPIRLPFDSSRKDDRELVNELASEIQESMQSTLTELVKNRN